MKNNGQKQVSSKTHTIVVPDLDHDAMMLAKYNVKISPNGRMERRIVAALFAHMAKYEWVPVAVDGGDGPDACTDAKSAMELIFNLDDSWVTMQKGGRKHKLLLIGGNGCDILSNWGYDHDDADKFNAALDAFEAEEYA